MRCTARVAALSATALLLGASSVMAQSAGDPERGRQVYQRYCEQCHGDRGDGKGEVARWAQPKPRDFRQGHYKFRSTPYGSLPTTSDIDRVIRDGLYGTLMPPFEALNPRARRDVIAYLQTFSSRWRTEQPGAPVVVPGEPVPTRGAVTKGRELFGTYCSTCHGDGTGNGPTAAALVDAWGAPLPPADLTRQRTKSARTASDIFLRVMTGLDGTPMPGFSGTLTPEQVWQIAHYVEALGSWSGSSSELRTFTATLPPAAVPSAAPAAPADMAPVAEVAPIDTTRVTVAADTAARTPATSVRAPRDSGSTKPAGPANPPAATTAPRRPATIVVRMVMVGTSYRYEPAAISARVGDIVRFVNVSGGPHNVAFWADSIPAGSAVQLQRNMGPVLSPLIGALVTAPNAEYRVSLAGLAPGTYKFYCLPHLAFRMTGRITVQR